MTPRGVDGKRSKVLVWSSYGWSDLNPGEVTIEVLKVTSWNLAGQSGGRMNGQMQINQYKVYMQPVLTWKDSQDGRCREWKLTSTKGWLCIRHCVCAFTLWIHSMLTHSCEWGLFVTLLHRRSWGIVSAAWGRHSHHSHCVPEQTKAQRGSLSWLGGWVEIWIHVCIRACASNCCPVQPPPGAKGSPPKMRCLL